MTFKEKHFAVTLVNFSLILAFFLFRIFQMLGDGGLNEPEVFRLWGIVIFFAIVVSVAGTILTMIVSAVIEAIRTGNKEPDIEGIEDERDLLIDLKGTRLTYQIASLGTLVAMLSYVLGQSAVVMFTLLIVSGIVAQILGDIRRLYLYRRGF